ncbi:inositol polyphosphate 5-phosphatase K-like isoform X1 [Rhagoletis pomonella]|uniref:inositol polyphosphate 5-phosphatase K-like isoform X1 n=2 Tax=Rhagoletis pomonella TaxID=28610 RepID=UPI00177C6DDA|nr:inositol polyphosphate 5-phosphatase K-like isoform X1 [Rhagoletis pomonella]XP_036342997.1 inositol polyphosphate 5-phosphatase K-like isoform X1 [Rhagoletis pomonella]
MPFGIVDSDITIMSSSAKAGDVHESVPDSQQLPQQLYVETFSVYVVTWNVGTRFPDNISLRSLLGLQGVDDEKEQVLPDIYAIGLQEVNVQPQQQMLGLFKEDPWTHKVKKLLRDFDYVVIKTEQMQGLLLTLLVRRPHVQHMRDIEPEFTRTGFGGIWGNKGAVSIRFSLYGCALTFVVAHLAAHDHHLDERIEDYEQIMENHHYHVPHYREIYDHDYVFWFGDLNFRLMGDDSPAEVLANVKKEEVMSELIQRDQLLHVRTKLHKAFHLMHERLPAFPPTFKFHEGTSNYDLKRRPAWTDRILYALQPLNKRPDERLAIEQRSYKSHPAYNISDHKPVSSEFSIKLYPNYRATCVTFKEIAEWQIGEENIVQYLKPNDFEERNHDWIGIYREDFASLSEYIGYEYVNQAESPPSSPEPRQGTFETPGTHRSGRHRHRNHERLRRQQLQNEEDIRLDFSDDINMRNGERYLLIYFQNTGLRGVTSVAGVSNVFRAITS